jgi:hypothetical protein
MIQYDIITKVSIVDINNKIDDTKDTKNKRVTFDKNVMCYIYSYKQMTLYKNSIYYVNKVLKKIK